MAKGRCVTAKLEVMPSVLALMQEYKKMHPQARDADAYGAAYKAMHQEMQRQTMMIKSEIFGPDYYLKVWGL